MKQIRIYDVKSSAASNYQGLISSDKEYIFWSLKTFSNVKPGDNIYFVNRWKGEALRTVLSEEKVPGRYDSDSGLWRFRYGNQMYSASVGPEFGRLDIMEYKQIPEDWKWQSSLGQSQQIDVWKPGIKADQKRIQRVEDLIKIFNSGQGFEELKYYRLLLQEGITSLDKEEAGIVKRISNSIDFQDEQRNVLMAIKTKPFLLLAGLSGVGKSHLVRTLAYRTCTEKVLRDKHCPGNFELLKVKPNWHDSTELMGYPTQLGGALRYVSTPFIRFLVKAWRYKRTPFFLCLDEMNLAPVERYFAEYLSILETRRYHDKGMSSDAFISKEDIARYAGEDDTFWTQLKLTKDTVLQRQFLEHGITLPHNLVVVGTLNMDETTHTFSKKVLDRAMTIEMNTVDMDNGLNEYAPGWQYPTELLAAEFLLNRLPGGYHAYQKDIVNGRRIINELKAINLILDNSPFKFAYRVRDEILTYCAYHAEIVAEGEQRGEWLNTCLDEMLMMKVLSRIEGNESKCSEVIKQLMQRIHNKFPRSYSKLERMQWRLINWGYTSYWQL